MTFVSFAGRLSCIALVTLLSLSLVRAEQTATVVTSDPVDFVKGTGHVTRPVQPTEVFRVVAINGDEITIADAYGLQATLPRASLKIIEPTPAPVATTPATNSAAIATPPPASNSPPASPTPPPTAADTTSPADTDMISRLNGALQMSLFADTNLWGDDVGSVATRLHWPQESKTSTDASYRRYALGSSIVSVLGARAYSTALYGRNGHPTYVSIVFANKGDFPEMMVLARQASRNSTGGGDEFDKAEADLNAAVKADAATINAQLTAVLGDPETHVYGPTADSRETVHRWDWKGHAILFSSPKDEYAAIKIVPTEVADHFGDVANMDREAIKAALAQRVLKRDNGDVILQEIPMVNQGPKGYCVPATWERYLRYVDVPADMYVLAMIGNTGIKGTSSSAIRAGVDSYVESYHRRIESADVPLDVSHISKFIDQGLPLMWGCFILKDVEKDITLHSIQRKTVTDWSGYKDSLLADDKTLVPVDLSDMNLIGHMRMIIGYNAQTDELAISDSWGDAYAERWISVKEAQSISQNQLDYVQW